METTNTNNALDAWYGGKDIPGYPTRVGAATEIKEASDKIFDTFQNISFEHASYQARKVAKLIDTFESKDKLMRQVAGDFSFQGAWTWPDQSCYIYKKD